MLNWSIKEIVLPLKFNWKIARGESHRKTLYFVHVNDGDNEGIGEVARITGLTDTESSIINSFKHFKTLSISESEDISKLNLPTALQFGITSALDHLKAVAAKKTLCEYLNLKSPQHPLMTSFSIPLLSPNEVENFFKTYNLNRFQVLKLKISNHHPLESCLALAKIYKGPIRIDANESFPDPKKALAFMEKIKHLDIQLIEEPFKRQNVESYKQLKEQSPFPIFADESLQQDIIDESFADRFHGVNIKLMKAGSYQKARQQIQQAHRLGLQTMLGCMVESSLGIAGALSMSQDVDYFDLDGFLYFEKDPYDLVHESKGLLTLKPTTALQPFYKASSFFF